MRLKLKILLVVAIAACNRETAALKNADTAGESSAATRGVDTSATPNLVPPPAGTPCPMWGAWQACNVLGRLERAGMVILPDSTPVTYGWMRVAGWIYHTTTAELQVFLYRNQAEREKDTALLDTLTVSPRTRRVYWKEPARLVTTNNLAAIVISMNERAAERIALALEAGLPAQGSARRP